MEAPTLSEAIAQRVRQLRIESGMTQEALASRLRDAGFTGWTRSMVAALETRRRQISASDIVALSIGLGVPPGGLVTPEPEAVRLDDGSEVATAIVLEVLAGKVRAASELLGVSTDVLGADHGDDRAVARAAKGELERRLAARLGVDPAQVARTAMRLWGASATRERDRRAPDPNKPGIRRNISRRIRQEIELAIAQAQSTRTIRTRPPGGRSDGS